MERVEFFSFLIFSLTLMFTPAYFVIKIYNRKIDVLKIIYPVEMSDVNSYYEMQTLLYFSDKVLRTHSFWALNPFNYKIKLESQERKNTLKLFRELTKLSKRLFLSILANAIYVCLIVLIS